MINRIDCYQVLFELKKSGVDVEKQLKLLSTSASVPSEVIQFINENRPLHIREFYDELRKKGNSKSSKLYKNVVKEKQDNPVEAIKTASSLLTHIIIASESLDSAEVQAFYKQARASELSTALQEYFQRGDITKVLEELKHIRDDIKILENKGE